MTPEQKEKLKRLGQQAPAPTEVSEQATTEYLVNGSLSGGKLPPEAPGTAARYAFLVDKKYSSGLSPQESEELLRLGRLLDEENAAFYEPIIERLTALERQLQAKAQLLPEQE